MATINMLSWNIQVLGPSKYGTSANNDKLIWLIGRLVQEQNANVLVIMEIMSSVSLQVCYNICEAITRLTGNTWQYYTTPAQPNDDREAYGIFWQTNTNFQIVNDNNGNANIGLSPVEFPNNFSGTHGRRAAFATFRTTDTNSNFTVSVYHAPPNQQAILGIQDLAQTPNLYTVNNAGTQQTVPYRLLGGDYNLDINYNAGAYGWLTNPLPAVPPPTTAAQGAGTAPMTTSNTCVAPLNTVVAHWGNNIANWSAISTDYYYQQLDNIFYATRTRNPIASSVVDLIGLLMNRMSGVRYMAQQFSLTNPNGSVAFPNANLLPPPLNLNLDHAACAYILMRYSISDHLPLFISANI